MDKRQTPKLELWAGILLLVLLVGVLEYTLGLAAVLAPWQTVSLPFLLLAAVLVLSSYALRALRIYHYFLPDCPHALLICWRIVLQHNFLNNLLPMRAGELSFPLLMARHFSLSPQMTVPALIWFRLLDLHTLGLLSLLAGGSQFLATGPLILLTGTWLLVPWLLYRFNHHLLNWLHKHLTEGWQPFLHQLEKGLPVTRWQFLGSSGWTLLNWTVKLLTFAWILQLFIPITLLQALSGAVAGDLTSVLPVHGIAGAGTYEAGVSAGLLPLGISLKEALHGAVNLHLFLLGVTLLGGALSLLLPARQ